MLGWETHDNPMTCIIGLAENDKVYIGADSASVEGWTVRATRLPKVFRVGEFVIGYTDSFRMGQILQHHLKVQDQGDESDMEYMVRFFVEAVRGCLKEYGYAKVENNTEEGGTFLVGYKGHLYSVESDFQVNEAADGYAACGCGEKFALGAMKALEHLLPRQRIRRSLEIAAYFSGAVIPPFKVLYE